MVWGSDCLNHKLGAWEDKIIFGEIAVILQFGEAKSQTDDYIVSPEKQQSISYQMSAIFTNMYTLFEYQAICS